MSASNEMSFEVINGENIPLQLYVNSDAVAHNRVEEDTVHFDYIAPGGGISKPEGAFWTSTFTPHMEWCSDWIRWMDKEMPGWMSTDAYILKPSSLSEVIQVRTNTDLRILWEEYGNKGEKDSDVPKLKWDEIAMDYDGVHLTRDGLNNFEVMHSKEEVPIDFGGWDSESTAWFKDVFVKVKPIEDYKDKNCKLIAPDTEEKKRVW